MNFNSPIQSINTNTALTTSSPETPLAQILPTTLQGVQVSPGIGGAGANKVQTFFLTSKKTVVQRIPLQLPTEEF